jgi:hypothetical protein
MAKNWDFEEIDIVAEMPAEWRWAAPQELRKKV